MSEPNTITSSYDSEADLSEGAIICKLNNFNCIFFTNFIVGDMFERIGR